VTHVDYAIYPILAAQESRLMTRNSMIKSALALSALALSCASVGAAQAQETTTYTYDAKGRVTQSTKSGGPANGTQSSYSYDQADNRTNVTVTGSPNGSGNGSGDGATAGTIGFVVVPLNGFTLIAFTK
jgi:hypothetical protein